VDTHHRHRHRKQLAITATHPAVHHRQHVDNSNNNSNNWEQLAAVALQIHSRQQMGIAPLMKRLPQL